jgi:hypothetical protein
VAEKAEVLYPGHPWFGRRVYVHAIVERDDAPFSVAPSIVSRQPVV